MRASSIDSVQTLNKPRFVYLPTIIFYSSNETIYVSITLQYTVNHFGVSYSRKYAHVRGVRNKQSSYDYTMQHARTLLCIGGTYTI